jgi:hypothetical protein
MGIIIILNRGKGYPRVLLKHAYDNVQVSKQKSKQEKLQFHST